MPDAGRTRELLRLLEVRRNAAVGFGSGLVLALSAYAFRVGELAGPNPDARGSPILFLLLALVLAATAGLLLTAALTLRRALRLAREADVDRDANGAGDGDGRGDGIEGGSGDERGDGARG